METFVKAKELVPNPDFNKKRIKTLKEINYNEIDYPIIGLIKNISKLEYCFSLQSCYGHFIFQGQNNIRSVEELPINKNINQIDYRIAYLAFCIQESKEGKNLLSIFKKIPLIDPKYVQFGCAEWFWERQINSFVIQVEPERYSNKDRIYIEYEEARHIEKVKKQFFNNLKNIIQKIIN